MTCLLRVDGRYVCWNSFAGVWQLGPRRLSEMFVWSPFAASPRLEAAHELFQTAQIVWTSWGD